MTAYKRGKNINANCHWWWDVANSDRWIWDWSC